MTGVQTCALPILQQVEHGVGLLRAVVAVGQVDRAALFGPEDLAREGVDFGAALRSGRQGRGERKQGGGQQFFHGLFYIKHQSLEVFAFGMVDVDWVVGGLGQLVQDAHLAACDGGGGKDRRAEQLFRDGLRAGEREEDAPGADLRQGPGVEPLDRKSVV